MPELRSTHKYQGHNASIYKLIQQDEMHLLSCAGDGYIVQWKIDASSLDGQLIATVPGKIFSMSLIRQDLLMVGDMNGVIYWVDLDKKKTLKRYEHYHSKGVFDIFSTDKYSYTGGGNGYIVKWDNYTMQALESIQLSIASIRCIIQDNNNFLLAGASNGCIYSLDTSNMYVDVYQMDAHTSSVFCLVSSDNHLYSGGRDAHINKYSFKKKKLDKRIPGHWFTINDLSLVKNHNLLVSASRDKKVRLWDSNNLKLLQSIDLQKGGHVNSVNSLLSIDDGKVLFSASDDRSIIRYELNY